MHEATPIRVADLESKTMRSLTFGLLATLTFASAFAARAADLDYDVLRGPDYEPPVQVIEWSGFYIGAHGGYTSAALGHRDFFDSTLAGHFNPSYVVGGPYVSQQFIPISGSSARDASYGAFAGYNTQFDEVVLGIEADYTHFGRSDLSHVMASRVYETANGGQGRAFLIGTSSTKIEDYGTVRARVGYAFGDFLAFATAGVAVGQLSLNDKFQVQLQSTLSTAATKTTTRTLGGGVAGAGIEYAITPNFLLRGEYQYIRFEDVNARVTELNTVRAGAAIKF